MAGGKPKAWGEASVTKGKGWGWPSVQAGKASILGGIKGSGSSAAAALRAIYGMPSLSAYEEWPPVEAWMRGKAGPALRWELVALQALGWDVGPWDPPWGWGKGGAGIPATTPAGAYREHAPEEYEA